MMIVFLACFALCASEGTDYDALLSEVKSETAEYKDPTDDSTLIGYAAYPNTSESAVPVVLVVHNWNGLDGYERWRARKIANDFGYVGFALDIYGNGAVGSNPTENRHMMAPFREDRLKLLKRLQAGFDKAKTLNNVNGSQVASIGYCFGGMASIDMARGGIDMRGAASFHGALQAPGGEASKEPILAKVLVMTGYNDGSIPPTLVADFEKEMTERKANFEVVSYSNTYHSFTEPDANVPGRSVYNEQSDRRSWDRLKQFLEEIFE